MEVRQCPYPHRHIVRSVHVVGLDIPRLFVGLGSCIHVVSHQICSTLVSSESDSI